MIHFYNAESSAARAKKLNELAETYIPKDDSGFYPDIAVGIAKTLTDEEASVDTSMFAALRPTRGEFLDTHDGAAEIRTIRGNTIFWNQLVYNGNFEGGTTGWSTTRSTMSVSNKILTITVTANGIVDLTPTSGRRFDVIAGRKYLVFVRATSPKSANSVVFLSGTSTTNAMSVTWEANVETTIAGIITADTTIFSPASCLGIRFGGSGVFTIGDEITVRAAMVFDLTGMFGAGNEPSAEEFRAMFPLDWYAKTLFVPLHLTASGIKTIGFNAWDGVWESGTISSTNGTESSSPTTVRSKNFIPVLAGKIYRIFHKGGTNDTKAYPRCYDAEKKYLGTGGNSSTNNGAWTMPVNCCYLRFVVTNTTELAIDEINISLQWSGYRNGEQEMYWSRTRDLPITDYFPDGMRSAGVISDELSAQKAVQKVATVDMGDLTWGTYTPSGTEIQLFYATVSSAFAKEGAAQTADYALTISTAWASMQDRTMRGYVDADTGDFRVMIRDDRYTTAADFKTAMDGKILFYALEAPVTTVIAEPLNFQYMVSDYGTEELLPANGVTPTTAPIIADIHYSINVQDTVRRLPSTYISKASWDDIATALGSIGISVTLTWNDTYGRYVASISDTRNNRLVSVPASATASGTKGTYAVDSNYLYVCVDENTWKRVAIAGW